MVKMRNALLLLITMVCFAQGKHSLLIQGGYFSSNTDKVNTEAVKSPYLGIGYGYKFNNYFSVSVEPGAKFAGFYKSDTLKLNGQSYNVFTNPVGVYLNIPVYGSVDIGRNKVIIGIDGGFSNNIILSRLKGNPEKSYMELLFGLRAGYKLSENVSLEAVYRFGGGLNKFASHNLNSNYLLLQTRINL